MEKKTEKMTQWIQDPQNPTQWLLVDTLTYFQEDDMPKQEGPCVLGGVYEFAGFWLAWGMNSFGVPVELTSGFKPEVARRIVEQYLININQLSYENDFQKAA